MKILGINAFHPDSSACLVIDGKVVAAIEEERIVRVKHWAGFPENAITACLKVANIEPSELDKIAINRDSGAHKKEKLFYAIKNRPSLSNIVDIADLYWSNLDENNKISVAVRCIDIKEHKCHTHVINRYSSVM